MADCQYSSYFQLDLCSVSRDGEWILVGFCAHSHLTGHPSSSYWLGWMVGHKKIALTHVLNN